MLVDKLLRNCISDNNNELIVFSADNFSQFHRRDDSIHSKCERALAAANDSDIVILHSRFDHDYHNWLRSCGLGSSHIVNYDCENSDLSLSEIIINDPNPVLKVINELGRKPVYTPWFNGKLEAKAAIAIGAEHFGASGELTVKYNDKGKFKILCEELGISVIQGETFTFDSKDNENYKKMAQFVDLYLENHETVIIRGTLGESGMSLYKTNGQKLEQLYREILATGEKQVLIEPFLKDVSSTPNDQWAIDRKGNISHLGMLDQICEEGMVHIGNLKGKKWDEDIYNYIQNASLKIVTDMAKSGYCGVIGIDYIISSEGIFPVENNARFNGSSYVSMVVNNIEKLRNITIPFWKFIKTRTSPCSFTELTNRLSDYLYDGIKINTVFPLNCNELSSSGDFAIVLLGESLEQITKLEKQLKDVGVTKE
jgi:hypothetical protein